MANAVNTLASTALRARKRNEFGALAEDSCDACDDADAEDQMRLARLVRGGPCAIVAPPRDDNGIYEKENEKEKVKVKENEKETGRTRWGEEEGEGKEGQWGWEDEVWRAMMVKSAPELLIRTSGEIRLSDFMLWQVLFLPFYFLYFVIINQFVSGGIFNCGVFKCIMA